MAVSDYQLLFNGLLIGDGTVYEVLQVDGADSFSVRANDQVLPSVWGAQPGGDFVNARTIFLTVEMISSFAVSNAFESAFLPAAQYSPATLSTLVWKFPDRPEVQVACRVRNRARSRTVSSEIGVTQWVVQLDAPDPRLYAYTPSQVTAAAFTTGSDGLDFTLGSGVNLGYDFSLDSGANLGYDFTGMSSSGAVSCLNAGNVDTYPTFLFSTTSSMNQWQVTNDTTGETATFVFGLSAGSTLMANMAGIGTGITDPPITVNGAANYAAWQAPRMPVRLIPGTNSLRFNVTDGATSGQSALISWRSAYL